jgi:trimeric autotransporter adhesin
MKTRIQSIFVVVTLLFLGLLPQMRAVSPPPDGDYPNFTTAEGENALFSLTSGIGNTGLGWYSLNAVTDGSYNTGVGAGTLVLNTADSNTAVGTAALLLNTTGTENVGVGTATLVHNDSGSYNTTVGTFALYNNIAGNVNTAVGRHALFSNNTGNSNVAVGVAALEDNISGIENTAIGGGALGNNIDGADNVAVGQAALNNDIHGSHNVAVGEFAGNAVTTANNVICIGDNMQGQNLSDSCFIGNIFNATATGGSAVFIDANNKLGTITSSKRFKEDIRPMGTASEALFSLQPVTFRYKKEINPAGTPQLGLVAEEVEKVNPDLVVRDKEGKPYSVRYDQVNAMLLNEFLKEHRKVEQQEATIAELKKGMETLIARSKEQDARIQKVSDQIEMSRPAPQMVLNNP